MDRLAGLSKTKQTTYIHIIHILFETNSLSHWSEAVHVPMKTQEESEVAYFFCTKIYLQSMVRHAHYNWLVTEVKT